MARSQTWSSMTDNLIMTNSVTSHPSSRIQGGWTGRTKWTYVTLPDGDTVIDPIMGFYRNPPLGALCSWSTNHGRELPVFFDRDDLAMPPRDLTRWSDEKLATVAAVYSQKYWEDMRHLVRPETFEDLYKYFDSATLWLHGAYNMWNLLNMLVTEAHHRWPAVLADWKSCIDSFINDYIHVRPGYLYNRVVLRQWDGVKDMLLHARGFHDWPYDEINTTLDLQQQDMVREALICQHMNLSGRQYSPPQYYPWHPRPAVSPPIEAAPQVVDVVNPVASVSTTADSVQLSTRSSVSEPGVATPTAPAVPDRSTVPRPSPPSAPLASIPEEPVIVKTDGLVANVTTETKTNDAAAKSGITAAESHTPVPKIVTKGATPPRDDAVRDRKDSNGSTDKLFFDPEPLSGGLQVQGRHLSISSAPEEGSEPMLNGADVGAQKRIVSEAPPTVKTKHVNKPSQQKPTGTPGPGINHANKSGRQGLARAQRKPTPTNGPMQYRSFENASMHRPAQQSHQHGLYMRPSAPQQMMSTFVSPNGTALPPSLFVPNPPGIQPDPNGILPHVPPPASSMPPTGPPIVPFQDQIPIPPPHTGQTQFDCLNEPPVPSMSVHQSFMGPQHQGSAIYQPNGYIPQPEHHINGGFNGNGDGNQPSHKQRPGNPDNRRNSVNSNASRKVRDDPIHGAVYALGQPRKSSNASSGRRPSITSGPHRGSTGPVPPCKNYSRRNSPDHNIYYSKLKFHECPCFRCEESTRSAFVKPRGEVDSSDPEGNLVKHFAEFRPVAVKPRKSGYLVVFQTDLNAINAIQEACTSSDKSIKGWTTEASVWYPFNSKHYTGDFKGNVTGLPRHLYEARIRAASFESNSRRDSNPLRGAGRPTVAFNDTNVTSGGPGPMKQCFQPGFPPSHGPMSLPSFNPGNSMPFQPMPPAPSQRQLWVPPASAYHHSAASSSLVQVEQRNAPTYSLGMTAPRREEILQKEDWRSKPPSEEALSDDGGDVAVTDTASNHSSQGVRSIKVSLPSEDGSAREAVSRSSSRSASPEVDGKPQEISQEPSGDKAETGEPGTSQDSGKEGIANSEPREDTVASEPEVVTDDRERSATSSRTITPEAVEPVETHKKKKAPKAGQDPHRKLAEKASSKKAAEQDAPRIPQKAKVSGYRKTTADLTAPVESFEDSTTQGSYRKTTHQLSSAVEQIGYAVGTVIRHKPSRSPLPTRWAPDESTPKADPPIKEAVDISGIRARFGEIGTEITLDELLSRSHQLLEAQASDATEPPAKTKQAPQTYQPKKNSLKTKKGKARGVDSHPATRSNTPFETQPRGPSPASNHPPAAAAETASSPSGPSPTMQNSSNNTNDSNRSEECTGTTKKKSKSKGKRKPTQTASEFSNGLAKSSGSQDNKEQDTRQGSPSKKPKTSQLGPVEEKDQVEGLKVVADSQNKPDEQHNASNNGKYRANNGGSLRMHKSRAPAKGDAISLCTIFEPPTKEAKDVSPDANLFPQQKFSIDQARKAGPPPKMSLDANTQQIGATKNTRNGTKDLHTFPQTKPISKQPSVDWAAVVRGSLHSGKNDDPFSPGKRERIPQEWIQKSTQKSKPQADDVKTPRDDTSPTPSPDKKSQRPMKSKSKLNATARSFTSSRTSSPAAKLRLDPTAKEFTSSRPSSPALSVVSAAGCTGGSTVNLKENEPPQPTTRSVLPKQPRLNDSTGKDPTQGHAKKPSLPGQSTGIDKRFVTPAEQVLDPTKISQPGPPAKEKKNGGGSGPRHGSLPDHAAGNPNLISIASPRPIPANSTTAEQSTQATKIEAATNTAANGAPSKADNDFPSLDQAAAVGPAQKKSTASIVKAAAPDAATNAPISVPMSGKATTTAAQKGGANQNQTQGQRSVAAPAPAVTETQQPTSEQKQPDGQKPNERNMWQTVGSAKKTKGGGTAQGHAGRGGRSGRWGHQGHGDRGGRGGSAEERKGY